MAGASAADDLDFLLFFPTFFAHLLVIFRRLILCVIKDIFRFKVLFFNLACRQTG